MCGISTGDHDTFSPGLKAGICVKMVPQEMADYLGMEMEDDYVYEL